MTHFAIAVLVLDTRVLAYRCKNGKFQVTTLQDQIEYFTLSDADALAGTEYFIIARPAPAPAYP